MRKRAAHIAIALTLVAVPQIQPQAVRGAQQWHLTYLNADEAQKIATGRGVTVAVIDSGVEIHHDLADAILPGTSFLPGDGSNGQKDEQGHGTAIAGLIAGRASTQSAAGIAPDAKILPIRVFDSEGKGSTDNIAKGIRWAVTHGAKVINLSNSGGPNAEIRRAVEEALAAGIIIVASPGNKPTQNIIAFPAYLDGVIAVGATDKNGGIADVSITGDKLSLTAPGVDLISTWIGQKYQSGTGTSGSAAIVSGVAALVWSRYPGLSAAEVVHRMTATAVDKGAPGRDPEYGFGIVDPVAALTADVPPLGSSAEPAGSDTPNPPPQEPNTMGQVAVILVAVVASLLGVALVVALLVFRLRGQHRRNEPGVHSDADT
ncbi:type VII secretion-associated serine protease mycosin [Catenuloplanes sp. NPDC051500]|uniref:type VII secretion-associated serine protease mycosin n=1 Tax=Catenuloplanes sp. NPDC051500 TaxID=3363959 RepID=UPI0037B6E02B